MLEKTVGYTSMILKATALVDETRTLLSHWDENLSVKENLENSLKENIFGKSSRKRISVFLRIFRKRYMMDPSVAKALVTLHKSGLPANSLTYILYFFSAQADPLLHDIVTYMLSPRMNSGDFEININQVMDIIREWANQGKMTAH